MQIDPNQGPAFSGSLSAKPAKINGNQQNSPKSIEDASQYLWYASYQLTNIVGSWLKPLPPCGAKHAPNAHSKLTKEEEADLSPARKQITLSPAEEEDLKNPYTFPCLPKLSDNESKDLQNPYQEILETYADLINPY